MKSAIFNFVLLLSSAAAVTKEHSELAKAHHSIVKDKIFAALQENSALIQLQEQDQEHRHLAATCPPEMQELFQDAFLNEALTCSCSVEEFREFDQTTYTQTLIQCDSCLLCHNTENVCVSTSLKVTYVSHTRTLSTTSCVDAKAYDEYEGELCVTLSGDIPLDPGFGVTPDGDAADDVDPEYGLEPSTLKCYASLNDVTCASCDVEQCDNEEYDLDVDCSNVVPGRIFPACVPGKELYGLENPILGIDPGFGNGAVVDPGFGNPQVDPGYGNPNTPLLANMTCESAAVSPAATFAMFLGAATGVLALIM